MNDDILTQVLSSTRRKFYLPRKRFKGENAKYLDMKVFVPTNLYYQEVACQNGFDDDDRVIKTKSGEYFAICNHYALSEQIKIAADEVELCEFDRSAFDKEVKVGHIIIAKGESIDIKKVLVEINKSLSYLVKMLRSCVGFFNWLTARGFDKSYDERYVGTEDIEPLSRRHAIMALIDYSKKHKIVFRDSPSKKFFNAESVLDACKKLYAKHPEFAQDGGYQNADEYYKSAKHYSERKKNPIKLG